MFKSDMWYILPDELILITEWLNGGRIGQTRRAIPAGGQVVPSSDQEQI
jgi:hypothetical protein